MISRQRLSQLRRRDHDGARHAIQALIGRGAIRPASAFSCVSCGRRAAQYDHHLGYEHDHWYDVEPVCIPCHVARGKSRPSPTVPADLRDGIAALLRRPRDVPKRPYLTERARAIRRIYGDAA